MNTELCFVKDEQTGSFWITGRSLCQLISGYTDPDRDFTNWMKNRVALFTENQDFIHIASFPKELVPTKPRRDVMEYLISFQMARALILREKTADRAIINQIDSFSATLHPIVVLPKGVIKSSVIHPVVSDSNLIISGDSYLADKDAVNIIADSAIGDVVSVRELYSKITDAGSKAQDRDRVPEWFKERISRLNLIEGKDYIIIPKAVLHPFLTRKVAEIRVTVKAAISICSIEQKRRGIFVLAYLQKYQRKDKPTEQSSSVEHLLQKPTNADFRTPVEPAETNRAGYNQQEAVPAGEVMPQRATPIFPPLKSRSQQLLERQQQIQEEYERALKEEQEQSVQATTPDAEQWAAYDQRIAAVESRIDSFLYIMRQAAAALLGDLPVGMPLPELVTNPLEAADFSKEPVDFEGELLYTPRRQLVQLVSDYAVAKHLSHKQVWGFVYDQLNTVYHFNVSRKQPKENYLDYADRSGQLDNLLSIAQSSLKPVVAGAQA